MRPRHLNLIVLIVIACPASIRAGAAPGTQPASQPVIPFVITAPDSQPATTVVPIETLRKSFAATYRQAQMAEAKNNILSMQQALGAYRKLQSLADRYPDVTDSHTKAMIPERIARVQANLVELRKAAEEQEKEKHAARATAREEQRARSRANSAPNFHIPPMRVGSQQQNSQTNTDSQQNRNQQRNTRQR